MARYRKAAAVGNATSQYNIAVAYWSGDGVARDPAEAVRWYAKASEPTFRNLQLN